MEIPLRNIKKELIAVALVDEEDYDRVTEYNWCAKKINNVYKYAVGGVNKKQVYLHYFIMGKPEDNIVIDHINGNSFDNRKSNLRFATKRQNAQNKSSKKQYIGAYKFNDKYLSQCSKKHLGSFDTEEEAARMYDIYVYITFGKDGKTNNLISYEEAIAYKLEDIMPDTEKKSGLPKCIFFNKITQKYRGEIEYNKEAYRTKWYDTVNDALYAFREIQKMISIMKNMELEKHYNQPILYDENHNAIIRISNGDEIIVDEDLWYEINKYSWVSNPYGYYQGLVDRKLVKIHQFVYQLVYGYVPKLIDHSNKNKSDNRIKNLIEKNHSENNHNKCKHKNASSKYYGVSLHSGKKHWQVKIKKDGEEFYLGIYKNEIDAALAYNEKAIELYGDHANLNIIE